MVLRLTSKATKTLDLGDGGELTVRADISKREFTLFLDSLPSTLDAEKNLTAVEAQTFTTGLFEALVVGWNATDEDGNPVEANSENYLSLPTSATGVIDEALLTYFNALSLTREERNKSKGSRS